VAATHRSSLLDGERAPPGPPALGLDRGAQRARVPRLAALPGLGALDDGGGTARGARAGGDAVKKPSPAVLNALRRGAPWVLAAVVLVLVGRQARDVEWDKVWGSVQALPLHVIG